MGASPRREHTTPLRARTSTPARGGTGRRPWGRRPAWKRSVCGPEVGQRHAKRMESGTGPERVRLVLVDARLVERLDAVDEDRAPGRAGSGRSPSVPNTAMACPVNWIDDGSVRRSSVDGTAPSQAPALAEASPSGESAAGDERERQPAVGLPLGALRRRRGAVEEPAVGAVGRAGCRHRLRVGQQPVVRERLPLLRRELVHRPR